MSASKAASNASPKSPKAEDWTKDDVTELFVGATIAFFFGVVSLLILSMGAELIFGDAKSATTKTTPRLLDLHNILGTCFSVMILVVLLPVGLPSRVTDLLSVDAPSKRQGAHAKFLHTVVMPLVDIKKDGKIEWFEVWTAVSVWLYIHIFVVTLLYLLYTGASLTSFIQLGADMTTPVTTILVKGYFAASGGKPAAKTENKRTWLSWFDVNHDGRVTKIDIFCGGLVLVYSLLQCSNTTQCLISSSTSELLQQLIALPSLVITLGALACFGHTRSNRPLFHFTVIVYLLLLVRFVVNVARGVGTAEAGGWLDCLFKVGVGMAGAVMQLVTTFFATQTKSN